MVADEINNRKENILLYNNLEKGDKVMDKNSKQIIEIMDNPPQEKLIETGILSGLGCRRKVIFKDWITPFTYPCNLMVYEDRFQTMKIGNVLNKLK